MAEEQPALDDDDILALTIEGERDLREPGTKLTAQQLELLILIDSHSTAAQVIRRVREANRGQARDNLAALIGRGHVKVTGPNTNYIDPGDYFSSHRAQAEVLAEADAQFLQTNGYCINMARRGKGRQPADRKDLSVLVIDDDPDIGMLLGRYLKLEGLNTRMAASQAEIEAELNRPRVPSLVLLDVGLKDMDGFHVLAKIRSHPRLVRLPVIMLTATATREVALKGIVGGADGHVTKPFQIHPLVRAVKAVLGLEYDPNEQDWDLSL
jgi:CheY-like chemotaxis protein